jgi:hypothetical protein
MSSVVKTRTPFLARELLTLALKEIGCRFELNGGDIITNREDYRGKQQFVFQNGRYLFQHEDGDFGLRSFDNESHKPTHQFIAEVEAAYNTLYKKRIEDLERKRLASVAEAERKKAEEEKARLERERREFVEKQREAILAKAKENNYYVQESVVDDKIKIVLIKTTY